MRKILFLFVLILFAGIAICQEGGLADKNVFEGKVISLSESVSFDAKKTSFKVSFQHCVAILRASAIFNYIYLIK